mmetsp:Transcript_15858/g.40582  ORF Transcript_15858/g.40582 Transcript_15858/m.40582 type:complete len:209 (-) Transcript_15858:3-629(-)
MSRSASDRWIDAVGGDVPPSDPPADTWNSAVSGDPSALACDRRLVRRCPSCSWTVSLAIASLSSSALSSPRSTARSWPNWDEFGRRQRYSLGEDAGAACTKRPWMGTVMRSRALRGKSTACSACRALQVRRTPTRRLGALLRACSWLSLRYASYRCTGKRLRPSTAANSEPAGPAPTMATVGSNVDRTIRVGCQSVSQSVQVVCGVVV